jgi:multidrug efflux pump subunit AcrB
VSPHEPPPAAAPAPTAVSGIVAWMARNPVAANLLMVIVVAGGVMGLWSTKQEVFPEFNLDVVVVEVAYPGASPAEVEQGIVLAVEEAVRGVQGVKRITATAAEGMGGLRIELLESSDPDRVLTDIKTEVDRVRSFPEEAEKPVVTLLARRRNVVALVVHGDVDLHTLHKVAEDARGRLIDHKDVTQVDLRGVPPVEIAIEVPRAVLETQRLGLEQVARQVTLGSIELPGGELETSGGELLVRVSERRREGHQLADIPVRASTGGAVQTLGDLARIVDGYQDDDLRYLFNGEPAVQVIAYRVGDETPKKVAAAARTVAQAMAAELPPGITVTPWNDDSEILQQRINLLLRNASMGLILVLLVLALFLELRLAFWVALGIPISFFGAFLLLPQLGFSINMITLFAFIITLGMVVDDAIIVGEHTFKKIQDGLAPLPAAITGAKEMAVPVTFAVLTTIAAFGPLLFVPGTIGKIFQMIPTVVIAVLILSLVESFFILPAHLGHLKKDGPRVLQGVARAQRRVEAGLQWFIERLYLPTARFAVANRYATVATALSSLFLAIGLVVGGVVPFSFFPDVEGDIVRAVVRLPFGAAEERAEDAKETLEDSLQRAIEEHGGPGLVRGIFVRVGESATLGGPNPTAERGGHVVSIELSLVPGDERPFTAMEFGATWRRLTAPIPGAEAVLFDAASGPSAGAAIDVQLSHRDVEVLAVAAATVTSSLRELSDLVNVENGFAAGKPQLDFRLRPEARALGLTASDIARQLRGAFFGIEALREQRGRDEVRVRVRLPESERKSAFDLERLRLRTPAGGLVPLLDVADFERGLSPTAIQREDGRRVVNVVAKLAPGVRSPQATLDALNEELLPALRKQTPGLEVGLVGSQRSQAEAFASLGRSYLFALFVIYALLAIPFRSYLQPFIVMSAIPFGIVGAVFGHLVLGYGLSIISMMGIVALSGVVVNDTLVLLDDTNRRRGRGLLPLDAILQSGARRLRPILLTSLTTFFGLLPMIFEREVQAQFLVPMAISLGVGVLFATLIALLVVPALYLIVEDVRRLLGLPDPRSVAAVPPAE